MRTIALINQKGGVGKTTTTVNLGAALARAGRSVVVVDIDPQANLSLHLGLDVPENAPSTYSVLMGNTPLADALVETTSENLRALPTNIDLSGAELELAGAFGRETLLRDAIRTWRDEHKKKTGVEPVDYLLFDCPPSLGLLSINGLAAADEVFLCVQTQFFALQGMSKLVEIIGLIQRRLHPGLKLTGIIPCLYDNRLKLSREVLGEVRRYFPGLVFGQSIATNVKLAEAPSFGKTIFEYAPGSPGARDYAALAAAVIEMEPTADPELDEVEIVPPEPAKERQSEAG